MNSTRTGSVGVIGGGLGGLAAACTLAARGYSVVLFEKNEWLGGKAAVLADQGFRFDMGPTILTMPSVLARVFAEADRKLEDYLTLIRVDPQWRSFFDDGATLDLWAQPEKMIRTIQQFAPGSENGYRSFLDQSARLHNVSNRFFFWRPIGGLRDMFDMKAAAQPSLLSDLLAMNPGRSVASTVRSQVPDARVAQMLDHFTQYVGSAPDLSPAVLCGIAHMQTSEGVWYPLGGTRAIVDALVRLARELGVELRAGEGVEQIKLAPDGSVAGVVTGHGSAIPLDAIVANSDVVRTHRELLGGKPAKRFERRRKYEPACSGVVLYLGLNRRYDHLLHHNFVFSKDPEEEFDFIYRRGEPAPDPTCYVCAPAGTEPDVAPHGGEALYVLVHTPYLRPHHDWKKMLPAYRKVILDKLSSTGGMADITSHIQFEHSLSPADIHERYGVLNGAIYGIASHGRWLGAFKPSNRSPDVKGLYLAGGAAHPGPGMPMVLMSGWIAADALDKDGLVNGGPSQRGARRLVTAVEATPRDIRQNSSKSLADLPPVMVRHSPRLVRLFTGHVKRRYLARNFHGVRLSRTSVHERLPEGPMIVALNHPSWWDPLMGFVLAQLFPDRTHFTPMDAGSLGHYGIFKRLGVFGIDTGSNAGARDFLRTSTAILSQQSTALWITPQGQFADARKRPVEVRSGIAHLIRRLERGFILPLALEYVFWDERYPEALARFGKPILIEQGAQRSVEEWRACIEENLSSTQDALALEAQSRSPLGFDLLVGGEAGVGGVYDWWRRLRARLTGSQFRASHGVEPLVGSSGGS